MRDPRFKLVYGVPHDVPAIRHKQVPVNDKIVVIDEVYDSTDPEEHPVLPTTSEFDLETQLSSGIPLHELSVSGLINPSDPIVTEENLEQYSQTALSRYIDEYSSSLSNSVVEPAVSSETSNSSEPITESNS